MALRPYGSYECHVVHGKFDEASWHLFSIIGLTSSYLRENHKGMVAVQQDTTYKREILSGDLITIQSNILEMREKKCRFYHEMMNTETKEIAATTILTGVHLDLKTRKSCPFPQEILSKQAAYIKYK